jgi:hypothetical protein
MRDDEIEKVLGDLLKAEIEAGTPPGKAPDGIFDGPRMIDELLQSLKTNQFDDLDLESKKILVYSVSGGYLGRGELLNPFIRKGLLTPEFINLFRSSIDCLMLRIKQSK